MVCEMKTLRRTDGSMVRAMCGVQLKSSIIAKDLMLDLIRSVDYCRQCLLIRSCVEERG